MDVQNAFYMETYEKGFICLHHQDIVDRERYIILFVDYIGSFMASNRLHETGMLNSPKYTKHIEMDCHVARENIQKDYLVTAYVFMKNQIADIF